MAGMKIKKGDTVQVISGKDRGAKGKVIAAYPDQDRVLVEGVNRIRKHTKVTTSQRGSQGGGIITQEASIHVSNVMVVGDDGKPTRIGHRLVVEDRGDGRPPKRRSVRISRRTGNDI